MGKEKEWFNREGPGCGCGEGREGRGKWRLEFGKDGKHRCEVWTCFERRLGNYWARSRSYVSGRTNTRGLIRFGKCLMKHAASLSGVEIALSQNSWLWESFVAWSFFSLLYIKVAWCGTIIKLSIYINAWITKLRTNIHRVQVVSREGLTLTVFYSIYLFAKYCKANVQVIKVFSWRDKVKKNMHNFFSLPVFEA